MLTFPTPDRRSAGFKMLLFLAEAVGYVRETIHRGKKGVTFLYNWIYKGVTYCEKLAKDGRIILCFGLANGEPGEEVPCLE
jgi:hypothetical protein